jgi:2,3-bisphosphoglycerate-dependent phosphoglycerate mutase
MGERILVLVRHGESEWNLKNLFTGWRDVGLTDKGIRKRMRPGIG